MRLKNEFYRKITEICEQYSKVTGSPSTRFIEMIYEHGVIEAARKVICARQPPDGFVELALRNRLDLTVEHVVVTHPEFSELFDDKVIERARQRLEEFGWQP